MRWLIVALVSLVALPAFAQDLALKRVMLSSGGLGYFEYEAAVDGDGGGHLNSLSQGCMRRIRGEVPLARGRCRR